MSALRFVAGIGAGAAIAALVAGATFGAPTAAEPEVTAQPRVDGKPAAPASAAATSPVKKANVERGVLARAAASRRVKGAEGANGHANGKDAKAQKDAVIESVEVDWGAAQARP